ncbi:MAG: ABC transporter ATP-binding protein [Pseudolysinimonas sp.]|uniref:ABC transporter ATP-binding protein n=1 Tax=Pseudolysinimonas sp. TaxID=2680009 RepID=UPI0032645D48
MSAPIVAVTDLAVDFGSGRTRRRVIEGVSFEIFPGRTLALVGESGSGKTTIGMAVLGLVPAAEGSVEFDGNVIANLRARERRALGRERQVVFQDPYSSLDPTKTVGYSLLEPARAHGMDRAAARTRAFELLARVGLDAVAALRYPAQFSGGQRQRIAVARALMSSPRFLVCDEPVSALDLSVQAEVMNLLTSLQRELGLAMLFVSHDLAVVRQISDEIVVLQHGRIVERGPAETILTDPTNPYTRRLIDAAPRLDRRASTTPETEGASNAHL